MKNTKIIKDHYITEVQKMEFNGFFVFLSKQDGCCVNKRANSEWKVAKY
jgi:hypothetical protein